jgi:hypothetical protein
MSATNYVLVLLVGAFALALWVDARFPQLAPKDLRRALLHTGVSLIASQVLIAAGLQIGQSTPSLMLVMIVAVIIPSLVYCLIAGIWVMKVAQQAIGRHRI